MEGPLSQAALDLLLRGGVVMLCLMIGAGLLRDRPTAPAIRLGALFALGAGAYAVCSTPGFHAGAGLWAAPFLALAVGNNLVFWLFARAVFDDGFKPRWIYAAPWAVLACLGVAGGLNWTAGWPGLQRGVGLLLCLQAIVFAVLAIVQTCAAWQADLVEPRRRLRVFIVAGSAAHIVLTAMAGLSPRLDMTPLVRLGDAAALALIAATVAWSLMRVSANGLLAGTGQAGLRLAASQPRVVAEDLSLQQRLNRLMTEGRAYRDDGLTIGRLAHDLGVPEYRLRRVINQGLGQRNFAAYLNSQRIAEAKAALADRTQDEVPILTIALDAGFGSLGPFNRAFKAETGMTPSEYRRAAMGEDSQASAA